MTKNYLLALCMGVSMLASLKTFAQANDDCAGAITITQAASKSACNGVTVTTTNATKSTPNSSCSTLSIDDDLWYSFTATSANAVATATNKRNGIHATTGIGFVLYTAAACPTGTTTEVGCNFHAAGDSVIYQGLTPGTTYLLRTFTSGDTAKGSYDLCVYTYIPPAPPANDICANATSLTVGASCNPSNGTFASASEETPASACSGTTNATAKDVWYKFVAAQANENIEITSADQAPYILLYSSCGGSVVTCAPPTAIGGTAKLSAVGLTPGTTYYVRAYNYANIGIIDGAFTICVYNAAASPANDLCANATSLTVGATCNPTNGTFASAAQETAADSCAGLQTSPTANDVWYKFVATNSNVNIDIVGASQAPVLVLSATCGGTTIDCKNPTTVSGTTSLKTTGLTIGSTYYVRTYNFPAQGVSNGTFTICAYNTPAPPANDDCAGAININPAIDEGACSTFTTVNTTGASQSTPHASCANASSDDDVWYKFTANDTAMTILAQNFGSGIAAYGASLFAGSCAGTEDALDCIAGSPDYIYFHNLTPGSVYYFDIFTNGTAATGTFDICVFGHDYVAGVASVSLNKTLSIYPNPAKDQLHVRFNANSNASVKLVDVKGQEVFSDNSVATNGSYDKVIDMSNIAQGVYMLQITSDKENVVRKIVKN